MTHKEQVHRISQPITIDDRLTTMYYTRHCNQQQVDAIQKSRLDLPSAAHNNSTHQAHPPLAITTSSNHTLNILPRLTTSNVWTSTLLINKNIEANAYHQRCRILYKRPCCNKYRLLYQSLATPAGIINHIIYDGHHNHIKGLALIYVAPVKCNIRHKLISNKTVVEMTPTAQRVGSLSSKGDREQRVQKRSRGVWGYI